METKMKVWVLEPTDTSKDSWKGSEHLLRIVVVAESESDARRAAGKGRYKTHTTTSPYHGEGTPPGERTTVSPWEDHSASSCTPAEKFDDLVLAIEPYGMR